MKVMMIMMMMIMMLIIVSIADGWVMMIARKLVVVH